MRRSAAIFGAVAVAAILIAVGVADGRTIGPGWIVASLLLALPLAAVLAVLAVLAVRWREAVLLGLVGLIAAAVALTSPIPSYQQNALLIGLAVCAVVWGARTALFDKGRWPDLVAGALIAWASLAWLYELSAGFHAL